MAIRPKKHALAIIISAARGGIGVDSAARTGIDTLKRRAEGQAGLKSFQFYNVLAQIRSNTGTHASQTKVGWASAHHPSGLAIGGLKPTLRVLAAASCPHSDPSATLAEPMPPAPSNSSVPSFIVAIPARMASTRLPGKPLAPIGGVPMIVHVARRALEAGATDVVVATDHASGSDRLAECAESFGWADDAIVVNLQGDEPLAPASGIRAVAAALADSDASIATLATPIRSADELFDPNCVKIVCDETGNALYFSRAPVPWPRDAFLHGRATLPDEFPFLRHIGIYAYRAGFLRRFARLPRTQLERIESLEQLRALEHGFAIAVREAPEPFPPGVDTAEDLARVERFLAGMTR